MGFFSWECNHCGKSIRSNASINDSTEWMKKAVVVEGDGSIIKGEYDGYGNIHTRGGSEYDLVSRIAEPCLYHEKCWVEAGKPDTYSPSHSAHDQGFFVGDD